MKFSEILMRERKARGLSQEELAAMAGVSRQAVSKWENGDAMPDLAKLLVLADTLGISLDALCGRNAAVPTVSAVAPPAHSKAVLRLALVCILLFALLTGSVVTMLSRRILSPAPTSMPTRLTEDFFVTGLNFQGKSGVLLAYRFAPSIFGEGLSHRISFTNSDGRSTAFDSPCVEGLCTGEVTLPDNWQNYTVTISVSSGSLSRSLAVAHNLRFTHGECSWNPVS